MSNRRRQQPQGGDDWDFFSFPTVVGFVAGIWLTALLISFDFGGFYGGVHTLLWYVGLIGVSFSLAHILTRYISRRRQNKRRESAEEEERERRVLAARARAAQADPEGEGAEGPRRRRRRRRP